jgi:hypothetical protein
MEYCTKKTTPELVARLHEIEARMIANARREDANLYEASLGLARWIRLDRAHAWLVCVLAGRGEFIGGRIAA